MMRLKTLSSPVFLSLRVLALTCLLASSAWAGPKYRVLHAFTAGSDGGGLFGSVVLDETGNVYGTTSGGGAQGFGTVFELKPQPNGPWTESVLHSFDYYGEGGASMAGLVWDTTGKLYGTTSSGGVYQEGTVFELAQGLGSWALSVLHDFGGEDGAGPMAPLVFDQSGNLYGTTHGGGTGGVAFELSPGSGGWTETVLYSFDSQNGRDGFGLAAPLIFDRSGNLYGTNDVLGANGYGTVFELKSTPSAWKERILHSFPAYLGDGEQPFAGLVMDSAGNLYGATEGGGRKSRPSCPDGCGMVFELTPQPQGRWKETVLHSSPDIHDGANFMGTLVFDTAGNLYGTTAGGGNTQACGFQGCGTVFKMTPNPDGTWQYTVLHRFTGPDGVSPQAGVVLDKQGNIYGTTVGGGAGGYGVVFEIKQ